MYDYDYKYEYSKTPQAKYDKAHTTFISLRLAKEADADIIEALDGKAKQTEVKRLVRLGISRLKYEENNETTACKLSESKV